MAESAGWHTDQLLGAPADEAAQRGVSLPQRRQEQFGARGVAAQGHGDDDIGGAGTRHRLAPHRVRERSVHDLDVPAVGGGERGERPGAQVMGNAAGHADQERLRGGSVTGQGNGEVSGLSLIHI